MASLGCGAYQAYLQRRGGGEVWAELPFGTLSISKPLDDSGAVDLSIPVVGHHRAECCRVLAAVEPWRDELAVWRDGRMVFVGPVINVTVSSDGGSIQAQDLFFWMERRFISEDLLLSTDASIAFKAIVKAALSPDPSPNIDTIIHPAGVEVVRQFRGKEFQRAADPLRELSRTAVDFVVMERQVVVGGKDIFDTQLSRPGRPLVLHDEGCSRVEVSKDGSLLATDVAVFGEPVFQGADDRIFGRATRSIDLYGLVQSSFAELLITDTPSANSNAASRLSQMQPAPRRVTVDLTPDAPFTYSDIIPGRHIDMRISEAAGCIEVVGTMRLTSADTTVSAEGEGMTETVSLEVAPLGVSFIEGEPV